MSESKNTRFISIDEQQREASHDPTGKIRKYLELAEKLYEGAENPAADAA